MERYILRTSLYPDEGISSYPERNSSSPRDAAHKSVVDATNEPHAVLFASVSMVAASDAALALVACCDGGAFGEDRSGEKQGERRGAAEAKEDGAGRGGQLHQSPRRRERSSLIGRGFEAATGAGDVEYRRRSSMVWSEIVREREQRAIRVEAEGM